MEFQNVHKTDNAFKERFLQQYAFINVAIMKHL